MRIESSEPLSCVCLSTALIRRRPYGCKVDKKDFSDYRETLGEIWTSRSGQRERQRFETPGGFSLANQDA